jgi:hypothetical protein
VINKDFENVFNFLWVLIISLIFQSDLLLF